MQQRLTDPQTIRSLLKKYGLWAKKRFGQNFLVDENVLQTIVETANIDSEMTVLEIGPGLGVLTRELLPRAQKVIAIEIDRDIIPVLRETTHFYRDKFELRNEHFLDSILPKHPIKWFRTFPIISHLLFFASYWSKRIIVLFHLHFFVQKEVAEQICNEKKSSLLSLFCGGFWKSKSYYSCSPLPLFFPPPKVDSAILRIDVFETPCITKLPIQKVFSTAKQGFHQKRKKLKIFFPRDYYENRILIQTLVQKPFLFDWERLTEQIRS